MKEQGAKFRVGPSSLPQILNTPLAETGGAAGFSQAREPKVKPVGEVAGHEDARVGGDRASPWMSEAIGERRPSRYL
jgi:hypothetical protein